MRYHEPVPRHRVRPAGGRIGVPRTLGHDELRPFFDHLLSGCGFELVTSPRSGPAVLERGLERCIDEVCFPLKVFFGHVAELAAGGIDTVLVPRLCSLAKGRNLCPKFHVLPDLIRAAHPGLNVLAPYVDLHHSKRPRLREHLFDACRPLLIELERWDRTAPGRLADAWERQLAQVAPDRELPGEVPVALIGHRYAERDPFLGVGVRRLLADNGARILANPEPAETPCALEEGMYYEPSVRAARLIEHHLAGGAQGVLLLTYFACGPDSYTADTILYRLARRRTRVPVMRLILDEHTSREGLETRVATFVEMARELGAERC